MSEAIEGSAAITSNSDVDIAARIHLLTIENGNHSHVLHPVTEATVKEALAGYQVDHAVHEIAWIDFVCYAVKRRSVDEADGAKYHRFMHEDTFVATQKRFNDTYSFETVPALLEQDTLPLYTVQWLRRFIYQDIPSAPLLHARTDDIRALATKLPPDNPDELIRKALGRMPNLREYYISYGVDVATLLGETNQ